MNRSILRQLLSAATLAPALVFATALPSDAHAQQGFALKGGAVFNSSDVREERTNLNLADATGWALGAEYLLPGGLAVGVSGYTAGGPNDFDVSEGTLVMLADANLLIGLPFFPAKAYGGIHVGLGSYSLEDVQNAVHPKVDFGDRGYQFGIRLQLLRQIGLDAQYRHVSGSLEGQQGGEFETNQVTLGVALF